MTRWILLRFEMVVWSCPAILNWNSQVGHQQLNWPPFVQFLRRCTRVYVDVEVGCLADVEVVVERFRVSSMVTPRLLWVRHSDCQVSSPSIWLYCQVLAPVPPATITSDLSGLRARPFSVSHQCMAWKQLSSIVTPSFWSLMYNWVTLGVVILSLLSVMNIKRRVHTYQWLVLRKLERAPFRELNLVERQTRRTLLWTSHLWLECRVANDPRNEILEMCWSIDSDCVL